MAISAVLIVTGIYVICLIALTLGQRRLMYFPCATSRSDLQAQADEARFKQWTNGHGQPIGWYRASREPSRRCLLIFHGNAGCATDRFHYADSFQAVEPIDVFILEYPGYGGRAGAPSQASILRAAKEALESIPESCSVFVVGESLGTGVASWVAGTFPDRIRGVYLIAPYNKMTAVAQKHMPLFPVKAMLRDKYPSGKWLAQYRGPVAVLLAGRDEVVPTELGRALFDGYHGPKKLWIEPEAGHNEVHQPRNSVWKEVVDFWNEHSR